MLNTGRARSESRDPVGKLRGWWAGKGRWKNVIDGRGGYASLLWTMSLNISQALDDVVRCANALSEGCGEVEEHSPCPGPTMADTQEHQSHGPDTEALAKTLPCMITRQEEARFGHGLFARFL